MFYIYIFKVEIKGFFPYLQSFFLNKQYVNLKQWQKIHKEA